MRKILTEWVTSLFGAILMAMAVYDFWQDKEFGYNVGLLILGLILLRMRDAWMGKIFSAFIKKFTPIIILLALSSTSCITQKKCNERYPPEVSTEKETTNEKETIVERHDTVYKTVADSSHIKALVKCDSMGNAYIKQIVELENGNKVKGSVKLVDNYVYLGCKVDSGEIARTWYSTHTRETISEKESKTEKVEPAPIIEEVSWWRGLMERFRSFFEVSGYILWILLILLGIKKFVLKI